MSNAWDAEPGTWAVYVTKKDSAAQSFALPKSKRILTKFHSLMSRKQP